MVRSRRRTSLLGILALLGGMTALVLTKFNPTGIENVPHLPIALRLSAGVAIAATALALIAFLAAASSPRTGAGLPLAALLVGAVALLLTWKPNLLTMIRPPVPAPKPAPTIAAQPPAPTPAQDDSVHHVKTIFDSDFPSSTPPPAKSTAERPAPSDSSVASSSSVNSARIDAAAAIRSARAKLEEARDKVVQSIEATPAYRAAQADVDAAEANLKTARQTFDPGSPDLIAASRAALDARSKLQELISAAAAHDSDYQDAQRQLQAAQASR